MAPAKTKKRPRPKQSREVADNASSQGSARKAKTKSPTELIHARINTLRKAIYSMKNGKDETFTNRYKGLLEEMTTTLESLKELEERWERMELEGQPFDLCNWDALQMQAMDCLAAVPKPPKAKKA